MAVVQAGTAEGRGFVPEAASLSAAQTGNGDSTNVVDTGASTAAGLLKITSTVGATPTVTVNIQGSVDGTTYFNVPYATVTAPATATTAALTITTATTSFYHLLGGYVWRYLKLVYSANTNVTLTADVWIY
jgi:hypothetical protein